MLEKELKNLLDLITGSNEILEASINKFEYTYNVAKEVAYIYNYVLEKIEDDAIDLPPNFKKIDINDCGRDAKEIYEIVDFRNNMLAILIKNQLKRFEEEKDVFESLKGFEKNEKKHIKEKIDMLEDEINDMLEENKNFELELTELEDELEKILSNARNRDCEENEQFKVAANTNLDVQKISLKKEKIKREIDRRKENISRKQNEIAILKIRLY